MGEDIIPKSSVSWRRDTEDNRTKNRIGLISRKHPFLSFFPKFNNSVLHILASYLSSASWRLHLCYRILCWHRWDSSR